MDGGIAQLNEMLGAGLEPARSEDQGILSPLCLPIPPPERVKRRVQQVYSS